MYIWSAQIQAKPGRGGEAAAKVAELRDFLVDALGRPAWAWAAVAGGPVGSFAMSTRLDGTGDLVDAQMTLAGNADYQALAGSAGDLWAGPAETGLHRVVATSGEPGPPKAVTVPTRAMIAAGRQADAVALAHEILERVTTVTGHGGSLALAVAGNISEVVWIASFDSAADADETFDAVTADSAYQSMIERTAGLFVDGSGQRAMLAMLP